MSSVPDPPGPPAAGRTRYAGHVLDREGVRQAGECAAPGVDQAGRPALVLDLEGVDRPTAAGLGELVALHRRMRDLGGTLILCNVSDTTYEALAVARLTELLEVRRPDRNGSTGPGAPPEPGERRV